jgi:putative phosphoribosyl transferase
MFHDREQAGRELGRALNEAGVAEPLLLGIARGGVIVAGAAAAATGGRVEVMVIAKVRAPMQPELGIGAVAADGTTLLDEAMIRALRVTEDYLEREIEERKAELARRTEVYRAGMPEVEVEGKVAVVVDDGIATGGTAVCAGRSVRRRGPSLSVLGVPVAPAGTVERMGREFDKVVCLSAPAGFVAVGQWYRNFHQVTDEEVKRVLQGVAH